MLHAWQKNGLIEKVTALSIHTWFFGRVTVSGHNSSSGGKWPTFLWTLGSHFVRVAAEDKGDSTQVLREEGLDHYLDKGKCEPMGDRWNAHERGIVSSSSDTSD